MRKNEREGILFCLVGPAGGGKTTVAQRLLKEFSDTLKISVSVTSRALRGDEVNGVSYHFVTRAEFEDKIRAEEFFEWEEIHGNLYGTLKKNLSGAIDSGKDLLLVIDIRGALNMKRHYPRNTVICFLVPPSVAELKERLKGRGDVSQQEFDRRFETAKEEFQKLQQVRHDAMGIDYFVVNDDLDETCKQIAAVLKVESLRLLRMKEDTVNSILKFE